MKWRNGFFYSAVVTFLIVSCTHGPARQVQSIDSQVEQFNQDPIAWVDHFSQVAKENSDIEELCQNQIESTTQMLAQLDFESLNKSKIESVGVHWLQRSFLLKKILNNRLPEMSENCRKKLSHFFRELRQTEDYIGELAYKEKDRNAFDIDFKKVPPPIIEARAYSPYQTTPEYENENGFQFEAGDVVITKGISFVSATISQATDDQTHFSHGVFVHKNPATGVVQTIESYLKDGVAYYSLEEAMKNENTRMAVFRARDRELASRASQLMSQKLDEEIKKGTGIPYDYNMDMKDHKRMTCAEIIVSSYEWASDGKLIIPQTPSRIRIQNPEVLKKLNIRAGETFSPVNMEIDPRFELIMEWRDYSLVRDQRQKDMIARKILQWMEEEHYVLYGTIKTFALKAIWATRKIPFLWNLFSKPFGMDKIKPDTPRDFLVTLTQLQGLGDVILKAVKKADLEYSKKFGYPMSEKKLLAFIEEYKQKDSDHYNSGLRNEFHTFFRRRE